MEPNKEHLKLWVEDLESGKHKQTKKVMGIDSLGGLAYCCLGRLCEIALADGVNVVRTTRGYTLYYDGETGSYVSPSVSEWAGVDSLDLGLYAHMNDVGHTFQEIAAAIRKK